MNLVLRPNALDDLRYWVQTDRKLALRILKLLDEVLRDPYQGTGKPEPLKYDLSGCWSRRIDQQHRLVYQIKKESVIVLTCRFHYH